ncbi:hypothetical protein [Streptacidiphilus carbonis]|uniref:hypothetical protein n=1 Tax=Streptacidiphilus carbonis TaxID=105422 RepID=UPI0005AA3BB1|nr:hypothetical protein [Streptacidiphilus carbonis]
MTGTTPLFGPNRIRPGYEDTEWSVWITGMDDILNQPDLTTALMVAAEHNAMALSIHDGSPLTPNTWAIVLHHGYAWQRPQPAAEQSGPYTVHMVVEIRCPLCSYVLDEEGEGVQCYPTEEGARQSAIGQGWTELVDGRVICMDDLDEEHINARAESEAIKNPPKREEIPGQEALPV